MKKFQAYFYVFICLLGMNFTLYCAGYDPRVVPLDVDDQSAPRAPEEAANARDTMPDVFPKEVQQIAHEYLDKNAFSEKAVVAIKGAAVRSLIFNSDETVLISGDKDGIIKVMERDGKGIFRMKQTISFGSEVISLALSKDGDMLISAHVNGSIKVMRKDRGDNFAEIQTIDRYTNRYYKDGGLHVRIYELPYSAVKPLNVTTKELIVVDQKHKLIDTWRSAPDSKFQYLKSQNIGAIIGQGSCSFEAFSHDGKYLVFAHNFREIKVIFRNQGNNFELLQELNLGFFRYIHVTFSSDGSRLMVVSCWSGVIAEFLKNYDRENGIFENKKEIAKTEDESIRSFACSHDGKLLVIVDDAHNVYVKSVNRNGLDDNIFCAEKQTLKTDFDHYEKFPCLLSKKNELFIGGSGGLEIFVSDLDLAKWYQEVEKRERRWLFKLLGIGKRIDFVSFIAGAVCCGALMFLYKYFGNPFSRARK